MSRIRNYNKEQSEPLPTVQHMPLRFSLTYPHQHPFSADDTIVLTRMLQL